MNVNDIIQLIPEQSVNEALESIQGIRIDPHADSALVRCHLSAEFRLTISADRATIRISAEGRQPVVTDAVHFLPALTSEIYKIDEIMAAGQYRQTPPPSPFVTESRPPAPEHFDIPAWDEKRQQWYDAEY